MGKSPLCTRRFVVSEISLPISGRAATRPSVLCPPDLGFLAWPCGFSVEGDLPSATVPNEINKESQEGKKMMLLRGSGVVTDIQDYSGLNKIEVSFFLTYKYKGRQYRAGTVTLLHSCVRPRLLLPFHSATLEMWPLSSRSRSHSSYHIPLARTYFHGVSSCKAEGKCTLHSEHLCIDLQIVLLWTKGKNGYRGAFLSATDRFRTWYEMRHMIYFLYCKVLLFFMCI